MYIPYYIHVNIDFILMSHSHMKQVLLYPSIGELCIKCHFFQTVFPATIVAVSVRSLSNNKRSALLSIAMEPSPFKPATLRYEKREKGVGE